MENTPDQVLLDFSDPAAARSMRTVNDDVMGGVSAATVVSGEGTAVFQGTLSLKNFGGFATCRTGPIQLDLSGYAGVCFRVKSDGRAYSVFLKNSAKDNGANHTAEFIAPADEWSVVRIPFARMRPVFRGMSAPLAGKLDQSDIRMIGFLIADKQEDPFRIEIDWIGAYREAASETK